MSSDLGDEGWEGAELILGTEAREAGTIAFHAWLKYRAVAVAELVFGTLGVALALVDSAAFGLLAVLLAGILDVVRRRTKSRFERVDALAEELAAVADASLRMPRIPPSS